MFVAGLLCLTRPSLFAMILGGLTFFAWPITAAVAAGQGHEFWSELVRACITGGIVGAVIVFVRLVHRFRNQPESSPDTDSAATDATPTPPPPENRQ